MIKTCPVCGGGFTVYPRSLKRGQGKFCSRNCMAIDYAKRTGEKSKSWQGGLVDNNCAACGKVFKVMSWYLKKGMGRFCSRKCHGVWNSEHLKGKNNHNWKGGLKPETAQIRGSKKYQAWRMSVFIRDAFTCQKCGDKTGGNLEAHHKKSFLDLICEVRKYLPLLPLVEAAMIYNPLWDIDNGETLCEKCHGKIKIKRSVIAQ